MSEQSQPPTRQRYHHGNLRASLLARAAAVIESQGIEALTLRGLARDLGVSHGAPNRHFRSKADLLAALAAEGYAQVTAATLAAARDAADDPRIRLNAMGRAFMRWAMDNHASFRAITHPDVARHADAELRAAVQHFRAIVRDAVAAAQRAGRHPEADLDVLTLFTNAVPFGAAVMLLHPLFKIGLDRYEDEHLIERVIDLVAPVPAAEE